MARILAVDDERAILDALARVLGRDGHEVVKASDPTAVPGMDLSRFDLVLCDVMMPGLDGFELVRQIRPDFDGHTNNGRPRFCLRGRPFNVFADKACQNKPVPFWKVTRAGWCGARTPRG